MTTPQVLALPLHPRRAQQLFQDVLCTDSDLTPELSEKSLPQRLLELQRLNLSGIQEAKRGTRFQCIRAATDSNSHVKTEDVTLQLTKDGSTLKVATETDTDEISLRLIDIKGILLLATPEHSFSIEIGAGEDGNEDIFVASNAEALNHWVITLTCGVNAFTQQQIPEQQFADAKQADLVWQAVRLRIFELAGIMAISTAVEHVTGAIPEQEYQQSEALRSHVQFLRCHVDAGTF